MRLEYFSGYKSMERTDPNLDRPGAVGNRICMNLQVPGGASLGKSPRLGSKMRVFSPHFAQLGSMGLVAMTLRSITNVKHLIYVLNL